MTLTENDLQLVQDCISFCRSEIQTFVSTNKLVPWLLRPFNLLKDFDTLVQKIEQMKQEARKKK